MTCIVKPSGSKPCQSCLRQIKAAEASKLFHLGARIGSTSALIGLLQQVEAVT